jgi:hypothetical protein
VGDLADSKNPQPSQRPWVTTTTAFAPYWAIQAHRPRAPPSKQTQLTKFRVGLTDPLLQQVTNIPSVCRGHGHQNGGPAKKMVCGTCRKKDANTGFFG